MSGGVGGFADIPYWNVDLPGLTREQAEWIAETACVKYGLPSSVVDPSVFLTLHMDRETALRIAQGLSNFDDDISVGVREIIDEWIRSTIR
ncbi:hypothetical protein GCM10023214_12100 [Amycolatopsis dongchuanensis]|uniref:Uncharacterized protein n=1 Tax=Amycolatopsis dongchuanensis TaxID=1070866 RepID=A0ABP9Q2S2_9PSEU